jgi:protein-S-isoprenylcysteine O-methyltransferase Ste14
MTIALEAASLRRMADRIDQIVAAALYAWLCSRLLPKAFPPQHFYPLMLLFSEGMILLFLVIRRGTEKISVDPRDWIVAFGCTVLPLLVVNEETVFVPRVGAAVMLIGFILQVGAKLNLRRRFGIVPADRGLQTLGLYAVVRHPMYLGYMITHIGFLLAAPAAWNATVYAIAWPLFIGRIFLEERFLSANPDYRAYCANVRYRLVPGLF